MPQHVSFAPLFCGALPHFASSRWCSLEIDAPWLREERVPVLVVTEASWEHSFRRCSQLAFARSDSIAVRFYRARADGAAALSRARESAFC